jgi:hypothetical protein
VPLRAWTSFEDVVQIGYRHACSCIKAGALDVFKV